jgi:cytochrome b6-f complex iron-sulfur subunit
MADRKMTRREFVKVGSAAAGAVALGGAAVVSGCGSSKKYPVVPMQEEKLVIDLSEHPGLREKGEGILFQVPNNHENIVVVNTDEGYVATGAMCPHQGCSVRWKKSKNLLVCPCHKAAYKADGTCVRGPGYKNPPSPEEWGKRLTPYNAVHEGDAVIVTALED